MQLLASVFHQTQAMDDLELYEEPEFDAETQERLDSQVSDLIFI